MAHQIQELAFGGLVRGRFPQIAFILRQAEEGTPVAEVCRKTDISDATFYNWKKRYGVRSATIFCSRLFSSSSWRMRLTSDRIRPPTDGDAEPYVMRP